MEAVDWADVANSLAKGATYETVAMSYEINVNTFISWCKRKGIKKRRLSNDYAKTSINTAIQQVRVLAFPFVRP